MNNSGSLTITAYGYLVDVIIIQFQIDSDRRCFTFFGIQDFVLLGNTFSLMLIEYVLDSFSVGSSTSLRPNHHKERQNHKVDRPYWLGEVFHGAVSPL